MKIRRRNILIILSLLIIILALVIVVLFVSKNQNVKDETPKTVVLDAIDEYSYTLEERDTELFKTKFEELKTVLNSEEINFEEYAKILSELYIIDLYTIDNKVNKYDIGSLEFVHPDVKDNFSLKVQETIYKYVEDNSKKSRKQVLPEVLSTEVLSSETSKYSVSDIKYDAYVVTLKWDYVEDLEYDTEANITLIKQDDFIYVVEQK